MFWRDFSNNEETTGLLEIKIEMNPFTIVEDFLINIITKINKRLTETRSIYLLSNNKDSFSLMIAKKNGEPKTDYPGNFNPKSFVFLINVFF